MALRRQYEEGFSSLEASDILTKIINYCKFQNNSRTSEEMEEATEAIMDGAFFFVPGSHNKVKCIVATNRKVHFLKGQGLDEFADFDV